ncbi:hypothetical protein FRC19_003566, partial [Serendipita sp. 401]
FGKPSHWAVERIVSHYGIGTRAIFEVIWRNGDRSWELYSTVKSWAAFERYCEALGIESAAGLKKGTGTPPDDPQIRLAEMDIYEDADEGGILITSYRSFLSPSKVPSMSSNNPSPSEDQSRQQNRFNRCRQWLQRVRLYIETDPNRVGPAPTYYTEVAEQNDDLPSLKQLTSLYHISFDADGEITSSKPKAERPHRQPNRAPAQNRPGGNPDMRETTVQGLNKTLQLLLGQQYRQQKHHQWKKNKARSKGKRNPPSSGKRHFDIALRVEVLIIDHTGGRGPEVSYHDNYTPSIASSSYATGTMFPHLIGTATSANGQSFHQQQETVDLLGNYNDNMEYNNNTEENQDEAADDTMTADE